MSALASYKVITTGGSDQPPIPTVFGRTGQFLKSGVVASMLVYPGTCLEQPKINQDEHGRTANGIEYDSLIPATILKADPVQTEDEFKNMYEIIVKGMDRDEYAKNRDRYFNPYSGTIFINGTLMEAMGAMKHKEQPVKKIENSLMDQLFFVDNDQIPSIYELNVKGQRENIGVIKMGDISQRQLKVNISSDDIVLGEINVKGPRRKLESYNDTL
jgi:hypothetical protein